MGAPGPPGGYVEQKYLRTGQYAPQVQSPHLPPSTTFYSQQTPSSYPLSGSIPSHPLPTTSAAADASVIQDRGTTPASSAPLDSARLMALLTTHSAAAVGGGEEEVRAVISELELADSEGKFVAVKSPPMPTSLASSLTTPPLPKTLQDNKLSRGRVLKGERIIYDVDVRKPEEAQPQLEVRPITTYASDPEPILGRQIAVNMDYICYGLRGATIRIINPELRALLRGHSDRVTDMAFAAEHANCLASASTDGRVFVRHILESPDADGKYLIQEHIVAAIQFIGNWEATNPRICWQNQDVLLVAVGKYILSIDLIKVQRAAPTGGFIVDNPVVCHMEELLEGISKIGEHDEDVTDLAIPSHSSSHIASASVDGLVRVWGQNKSGYLSSFAPHVGDIVGAVAFLSAPGFPENSVLLTAGYQMNRELKLWAPEKTVPSSKSSNIMWECIQTVEFQSSAAGNNADSAFFNQVAIAPQANLVVVANAKKNAIYVLHVEFGSRLEKAQINYLAEFSVTIPILSLTVKEQRGSEGGQGAAVQIYCVQTAAIQQYSLLVSQCLPMFAEKSVKQGSLVVDKSAMKVVTGTRRSTPEAPLEKIAPNTNAAMTDDGSAPGSAPRGTGLDHHSSDSFEKESDYKDNTNALSRLRRPQSENRNESGMMDEPKQSETSTLSGSSPFSSIDSGTHNVVEDEEQRGVFNTYSAELRSNAQSHHLVTPKQLMSLVDGSRPAQAGSTDSEVEGLGVVERQVGADIETMQLETVNFPMPAGAQFNASRESEASKSVHASEYKSNKLEMLSQVDGPQPQEYDSLEYGHSDFNSAEDDGLMEASVNDGLDHPRERSIQLDVMGGESDMSSHASAVTKQKKNKNKTNGRMIVPPASTMLPVPSTLSPVIVSESETSGTWNSGFTEAGLAAQVALMQESLSQLVNMQIELQKQMITMASVPVVKEGKRLEAMEQRMEKVLKAHIDAMCARLAEENAKREKVERERLQQITTLLNNFFIKEMPAVIERGMKKEFQALIPSISQAILPPIQKAISTGIGESFQKGIAEKLLPQLERLILGKLEASISRQLQTQFQTVDKQALQDALRSSFEGYMIPTFENLCRNMFEHVDSVFKHGMEEHVVITQQQFSSMHSPLASTLQETVTTASTLAQSLKGELAESNKKLAALMENSSLGAAVGSNRNETTGFPDKIMSVEHVEETIDPTVKLTKFLKDDKLEEAFHMALSLGDVDVVVWLCNQIDPMVVFQRSPMPLGQGILLSLVQQLGVEIEKDTKGKLRWIQEAVLHVDPKDPTIVGHVRSILEEVLSNLQRQANIIGPGDLSNQMRLVTHVVNSMLTACK